MSTTSPTVAATHPHPKTNTGLSNGLLGIMCFLTSELALFGSLIFAYLYARRAAPLWPPQPFHTLRFGNEWQLPTVNTVVLLGSGVTMHFAYQALRRGDVRRMLTLLVITIIMGAAFIGGQAWEYKHIEHLAVNNSIYGATFFTLTGLHGAHVTGGLVFLLIILIGTLKGRFTQQNDIVVHAATLYWHFVDAMWVVLFALFYLTV